MVMSIRLERIVYPGGFGEVAMKVEEFLGRGVDASTPQVTRHGVLEAQVLFTIVDNGRGERAL